MPNTKPDGVENISLIGGALSLDFANTRHNVDRPSAPDELQSFDDWLVWAERTGAIDSADRERLEAAVQQRPAAAAEAMDEVKAVRDTIFAIFRSAAEGGDPEAEDLDRLRDAWGRGLRHAHLTAGDERFAWSFEAGTDLSRPLWPVVLSAITLLGADEVGRVRFCGGHDCTWLFIDRSKNGRRRWCQMGTCGNREKARRHYSKRGQQGQEG